MTGYVAAGSQLVLEMYVRDIRASVAFYEEFGFEVDRDNGNFVSLRWKETQFFLVNIENGPAPPPHPVGNMRIMVPDVDEYWLLAQKKRAAVIEPIGDRYYGLRDFTIAGPDGIGLRFSTTL